MKALAKPEGVGPAHDTIPVKFSAELWQVIYTYAKAAKQPPEVIIAEACRAYLLGERGQ